MSGATKYEQDGDEARDIAKHLPYFPFKGIDRFYDIGGFLYQPQVFQRIVDIFVDRYREIGIDVIAGCVLTIKIAKLPFTPAYLTLRLAASPLSDSTHEASSSDLPLPSASRNLSS
jgi:hypothetical protein